ncbi:hypothetical protein SteCoe_23064 [Stentor coeruleus]|uniref:Uncharacterized protein n=1 Tax=Stentor coeruleus TaxID=5963 RepID=A0A1R2BKT3_9CILI|nr:hypothetical protein SteCoe_23064 [Stentor coeruleus]
MSDNPRLFTTDDTTPNQGDFSIQAISKSTFESIHKSKYVDENTEKTIDMISRRLKNRRHPLSGMKPLLPEVNDDFSLNPEFLIPDPPNVQKLNTKILETWINNTIIDSESLNLPSQMLKQKSTIPLMQYGIDRTTLFKFGIDKQDIDRLYRSLFIYSIGFYQQIQKILEHSNKKYNIITGIWKVYAILLEYCCQLDYQMIIKTLDIEKKGEIERIELDYQNQIINLESREKELKDNIDFSKFQLQEIQKTLRTEVIKREEAEDELSRRGTGHEEEVELRLRFECKLNQMYARLRDLEINANILNENLTELQKESENRGECLRKEKEKNIHLKYVKIQAESEIKKFEEKYNQAEILNVSLDKRINECHGQIEALNIQLGTLMIEHSKTLSEYAQKRIESDDYKFSLELALTKTAKLESVIVDFDKEKQVFEKRIKELESALADEVNENRYYKQEYVKIKESNKVHISELEVLKEKYNKTEEELIKTVNEKNVLNINLNSMTVLVNELRGNFKDTQAKLEEMSKARLKLKNQVEILQSNFEEKIKELMISHMQNKNLKDENEKQKNKEVEMEVIITDLRASLEIYKNQLLNANFILGEKTSNYDEIIESEKKMRETWVAKFKEVQQNHSKDLLELMQTRNSLNEAIVKISVLTAALEESNFSKTRLRDSHKEIIEEVHKLRYDNEEYLKKLKILHETIENNEQDYESKVQKIYEEHKVVIEKYYQKNDRVCMQAEDYCSQALECLEKYCDMKREKKSNEQKLEEYKNSIGNSQGILDKKNLEWEYKSMLLEDSRENILSLNKTLEEKFSYIKTLESKVSKVTREMEDFRNLAPPEIRYMDNPFEVLIKKIEDLSKTASLSEILKARNKSQSTQCENSHPEVSEKSIETDPLSILSPEKSSTVISRDKTTRRDHSYKNPNIPSSNNITFSEVLPQKDLFSADSDHSDHLLPQHRSRTQSKLSHKSSIKSHSSRQGLTSRKKDSIRLELEIDCQDYEEESIQGRLGATTLRRDEEKITPLSLRSMYNKNIINPIPDLIEVPVKTPHKLPYIGGKNRIYQANPLVQTILPVSTIPAVPSYDFKRAFKQATSRRKNE